MSETSGGQTAYRCEGVWNGEHAPVLVVHCSDSRFVSAVEEFLARHLGIRRADRYIVPGGPACLVITSFTLHDYDLARKRVRLLVELHRITRVILIAHEDCGFYGEALPEIDPARRRRMQHEHVRDAARVLRAWFGDLTVEGYFAAVRGNQVVFDAV